MCVYIGNTVTRTFYISMYFTYTNEQHSRKEKINPSQRNIDGMKILVDPTQRDIVQSSRVQVNGKLFPMRFEFELLFSKFRKRFSIWHNRGC